MAPRVASAEVKDAVKDVKEKDDLTKIDVVATTHDDLYDLISELNDEAGTLKTKDVAFKGRLTDRVKTVADDLYLKERLAGKREEEVKAQEDLVSQNLARLKESLDMPKPAPVAPVVAPSVPVVAPSSGFSLSTGNETVDKAGKWLWDNKVVIGVAAAGAVVLTFLASAASKAGKKVRKAGLILGLTALGVLGYAGFSFGKEKYDEIKGKLDALEDFKRATLDKLNALEAAGGAQVEEVRYELTERAYDSMKGDLPDIAKNTNAFARRKKLDAKLESVNKALKKMKPATQEKFLKEKGLDVASVVDGPFEIKKKAPGELEIVDSVEAMIKDPVGATALNMTVIHPEILRDTKANPAAVTDLLKTADVQDMDVADLLMLAAMPNEAAAFADPMMAPYAGNEVSQRALWFIAKAVKEQMDKNLYKDRKEGGAAFDPTTTKLGELLAVGGQGVRVAGRIRSAIASKPALTTDKAIQEAFKEAFDPSSLEVDAQSESVKAAIRALDPALAGKEITFAKFCAEKGSSPFDTVKLALTPDEKTAYENAFNELAIFKATLEGSLVNYVTTADAGVTNERKMALVAALKEASLADIVQLHVAAEEISASSGLPFEGKPAEDQALGRIQIRAKISELMSRKNPAAAKAYFNDVVKPL